MHRGENHDVAASSMSRKFNFSEQPFHQQRHSRCRQNRTKGCQKKCGAVTTLDSNACVAKQDHEFASGSQSEELLDISRKLDEQMRKTAIEHNLSACNVKSILHHLMKNADMQLTIRKLIAQIENDGIDSSRGTFSSDLFGTTCEPILTRAKAKEFAEKGEAVWPLAVAGTTKAASCSYSDLEAILMQELEDDDSDKEYDPNESSDWEENDSEQRLTGACESFPAGPVRDNRHAEDITRVMSSSTAAKDTNASAAAPSKIASVCTDAQLNSSNSSVPADQQSGDLLARLLDEICDADSSQPSSSMAPPAKRPRILRTKGAGTGKAPVKLNNARRDVVDTVENSLIPFRTRSRQSLAPVSIDQIGSTLDTLCPDFSWDLYGNPSSVANVSAGTSHSRNPSSSAGTTGESDDREWLEFLAALYKPEANVLLDDEGTDRDYNFMDDDDDDNHSDDEFRGTKQMRVSKKELVQLLNDLVDQNYQPAPSAPECHVAGGNVDAPLFAEQPYAALQQSDYDGADYAHVGLQRLSPATPSGLCETDPQTVQRATTSLVPLPSNDVESVSNTANYNMTADDSFCSPVDVMQSQQNNYTVINLPPFAVKEMYESASLLVDGEEKITDFERLQLDEQLRKHVQLLAQVNLLTSTERDYAVEHNFTRQCLDDLNMRLCSSSFGIASVYNAWNLREALQICRRPVALDGASRPKLVMRNAELAPKNHAVQSIISSKAFMYAELLPERKAIVKEDPNKPQPEMRFTDAEDKLIGLGYAQFHQFQSCNSFIQENLLPHRTPAEVDKRIAFLDSGRAQGFSPIAYFKRHGRAPLIKRQVLIFKPEMIKCPLEMASYVTPKWVQAYKSATLGCRYKAPRGVFALRASDTDCLSPVHHSAVQQSDRSDLRASVNLPMNVHRARRGAKSYSELQSLEEDTLPFFARNTCDLDSIDMDSRPRQERSGVVCGPDGAMLHLRVDSAFGGSCVASPVLVKVPQPYFGHQRPRDTVRSRAVAFFAAKKSEACNRQTESPDAKEKSDTSPSGSASSVSPSTTSFRTLNLAAREAMTLTQRSHADVVDTLNNVSCTNCNSATNRKSMKSRSTAASTSKKKSDYTLNTDDSKKRFAKAISGARELAAHSGYPTASLESASACYYVQAEPDICFHETPGAKQSRFFACDSASVHPAAFMASGVEASACDGLLLLKQSSESSIHPVGSSGRISITAPQGRDCDRLVSQRHSATTSPTPISICSSNVRLDGEDFVLINVTAAGMHSPVNGRR